MFTHTVSLFMALAFTGELGEVVEEFAQWPAICQAYHKRQEKNVSHIVAV